MKGKNKAAILTLTLVGLTSINSIAILKPAQAQNTRAQEPRVTAAPLAPSRRTFKFLYAVGKKAVQGLGSAIATYELGDKTFQAAVDCKKGWVSGANNLTTSERSSLATAACRQIGIRLR
jgi:hypothetical protein